MTTKRSNGIENMSDTKQNLPKFILAERGKKYLPGRVVSPEIDSENARRGGRPILPVNLADVKPAKNLRTDIAIDQELAERIAAGNTDATYALYPKNKNADKLKVWIPDGVLFKIQNVHDYFIVHADEHKWYDPDSMFAVRLQFDRMLFSYDHDFKSPQTGQMYSRHVNVVMEKATVADAKKTIVEAMLPKEDAGELLHILDRRQPDSLIKTYLAADGFNYPGIWYVMVDETGHVLTDLVHGLHWLWIRDPSETAQIAEIERLSGEPMQDAFARHGMICLTAVQFLNCRNVEVIDNLPTRQQRRHAERQGQRPPVTYKTLVIHPMGRKRVKTHNTDGTVVHGVPLHIVRGHFKNYTAGAGMGRYHAHGIYWWSPNLRGSTDIGRIEKDYEVDLD